MVYLVSRAICQGAAAGLTSLLGVAIGFLFWMLFAVFGLTALLLAVPMAYDAIRFAGAGYLLYLAWQAIRPGGRSPFELRELAPDSPRKLVLVGLFTNLLNPKAAALYLSLFPQFITPERGDVLSQSLALGFTQITISLCVNTSYILAAGQVARFLSSRPTWLTLQRWVMGSVLAALAVRMATEARR
jgi:threonine/homoserine/homoserine lactone efflux protein